MENYRGYWLHSQTGSDVTILRQTGDRCANIHLNSGWNLIAGISGDVPLANVTIHQISSFRTLQRYRNGYVFADTIRQGEGYWIKASGNGAYLFDINSVANSAPELMRTNALKIV